MKPLAVAVEPGKALVLAVEADLPVDRDRYELVAFDVFELHDLAPVARKLSPTAGFLGILLDGLILAAFHTEGDGAKAVSAGAADQQPLAGEVDRVALHHLLSDRRQKRRIEHD